MHLCRRCGGTGSRFKPSPNRWITCNKCRGHGTWGIPGPAVIICKGFNVTRERKSFKVDTKKE